MIVRSITMIVRSIAMTVPSIVLAFESVVVTVSNIQSQLLWKRSPLCHGKPLPIHSVVIKPDQSQVLAAQGPIF
jgi:hypothetical protein